MLNWVNLFFRPSMNSISSRAFIAKHISALSINPLKISTQSTNKSSSNSNTNPVFYKSKFLRIFKIFIKKVFSFLVSKLKRKLLIYKRPALLLLVSFDERFTKAWRVAALVDSCWRPFRMKISMVSNWLGSSYLENLLIILMVVKIYSACIHLY